MARDGQLPKKKIAGLERIVDILNKLPQAKEKGAKTIVFDSKKDEEIIKRFLERRNAGV